jgi:hypothetical protein
VERVVTVCKAPKNRVMANVEGGNQDGPTTSHASEPLCRRFEASDVVSNVTWERKVN